MSDETPARKSRRSAAPDDAQDTDPGADATAPAEAPDPTGTAPAAPGGEAGPATVASLLGEAERILVNVQIASPSHGHEINRVRVLLTQASELASSGSSSQDQPAADA